MKINLNGLNKDIYYEKLDNGLDIYVVPYPDKKNYSVTYFTKFGSNSTSFIPEGEKEYIKVPDGIAHFLEHKCFETEEGIDPFTFYAKSGTNANAFTSFVETAYVFNGTNDLLPNIDFLLTYVNSPYFTDKNVEKEKGIISEELRMYEDNPYEQLQKNMREATYVNDPYRVEIGGSVESIQDITKEYLYRTYNTFYKPSNMTLVVAGNTTLKDVVGVCKNNKVLMSKSNGEEIRVKEFTEPKEVTDKIREFNFPVNVKKFGYTIKLERNKDMDIFRYDLILEIILNMLFGKSSLFKDNILKNKVCLSFNSYNDLTKYYDSLVFMGESEKPKEVVKYINDTLDINSLTEEDFERCKKVFISDFVTSIDDVETTLYEIESHIINFGKYYNDKLDILKSITYQELINVFSNLDLSNNSLVIMNEVEK